MFGNDRLASRDGKASRLNSLSMVSESNPNERNVSAELDAMLLGD